MRMTRDRDGGYPPAGRTGIAFFHPDYTVGSGITPDLLTYRPHGRHRSRAQLRRALPPVGNLTLP
jgi:hypothetical protein